MLFARLSPQMAKLAPAETCFNSGAIKAFQRVPVGLFGVIPRRKYNLFPWEIP